MKSSVGAEIGWTVKEELRRVGLFTFEASDGKLDVSICDSGCEVRVNVHTASLER